MPCDGGPKRVGGAPDLRQPRLVLGFQRSQVAAAEDAVCRTREDELAAAAAKDQLRRDSSALSH